MILHLIRKAKQNGRRWQSTASLSSQSERDQSINFEMCEEILHIVIVPQLNAEKLRPEPCKKESIASVCAAVESSHCFSCQESGPAPMVLHSRSSFAPPQRQEPYMRRAMTIELLLPGDARGLGLVVGTL
jgi:hypothetical protein